MTPSRPSESVLVVVLRYCVRIQYALWKIIGKACWWFVSTIHAGMSRFMAPPNSWVPHLLPGERWMRHRDVLGLVLIAGAHCYWIGSFSGSGASGAFHATVQGSVRSAGVLVLAVFAAWGLLLILGGSGRRALAGQARGPLTALGAWTLSILVFVGALFARSWLASHGEGDAVTALVALAGLAAFSACISGLVLALQHDLRTGEGPPGLAPLTVGLSAAVATAWSLVEAVRSGLVPEYPASVGVLLAFGGPILTLGLVGADIQKLNEGGGVFGIREEFDHRTRQART